MASLEISMRRLPQRFAPFLFSVTQACVTTGLATAIATTDTTPLGLVFLERWMGSWMIAWAVMIPVVILAAPVIERSVAALTDSAPSGESHKR